MTWWEWLITGVFGGNTFLVMVVSTVIRYMMKHMDKFGPAIMMHFQKTVAKRTAQRANDTSGSTTS